VLLRSELCFCYCCAALCHSTLRALAPHTASRTLTAYHCTTAILLLLLLLYLYALQSVRTRKQILNKFKREEKKSPELINLALKARTPLDISEFEKRVAAANDDTVKTNTDAASDVDDDADDVADMMAVGDIVGEQDGAEDDDDAMEEVHE
jgi:Myb DNA-binding like